MLFVPFALLLLHFSFDFCHFDYCVSWCVPPWIYPAWDYVLPVLRWLFPFPCENFQLLSLKIFSQAFPLSVLLWDPCNVNILAFNVLPELSKTVLISLFCYMIFTILPSSLLNHSFASVIVLLIPSVFSFSCCIVHHCSLVLPGLCQTSHVTSQSAPPFFFWDFELSLLSCLWFIFQVDCLFPFHLVVLLGLYFVLSSWRYSSALSFHLTFCDYGFHSAGSRVVGLTSTVCPLVDEAV